MTSLENAIVEQMQDLMKDYEIKDGRIVTLGKFEGEHPICVYFYDAWLNGDGETYEDQGYLITRFYLTKEEKTVFPVSSNCEIFEFYETDDGFIIGECG